MRTSIGYSVALGIALLFHGQLYAQNQTLPDTQEETIPFTPPDKALEMISLPDGFSATLFAAEPDVHQPIAVTTDCRGRLWVVECFTYSDSKTNYDMSLNDQVSIFEDSDNDGTFDKKTVFWDKGKKLTGIELGYGGVWLTAAPEFIFIPDRDYDDKPDGPPQVLLDGFEDNVIRHNIVNGLRWGPDGWLYGRHGIQATSHVGAPGAPLSQRTPMNCAIWRYHPTVHRFEIVAEGGTNPWGFDYDEYGEMFMINTVIGHLFHVVPGARYRRMYGSHFNPHTYQVIEQTANHFHWDQGEEHWAVSKKDGMSSATDRAGGGHAHSGLMIYQGDSWPERYHNTLFTANFHGRRINNDVHERVRGGTGYVAGHANDFMKTDDPWFRGVELIFGPDGGVFCLDWSDIGECHENDGIHRTSGRIFKFVYNGNEQNDSILRPVNENGTLNLRALPDDELFELIAFDNAWYMRKALRVLAERAHDGTIDKTFFKEMLKTYYTPEFRRIKSRDILRTLWALHAAGVSNERMLLDATRERSEHVKAWGIRLLADGLKPMSSDVASRFANLAADRSGLVQMYVASSLNRFDGKTAFKIGERLLNKYVKDDRVQPHLIWYQIEPQVVNHWNLAIKAASKSRIPLIRENIVRRLTSEIETLPQATEAIIQRMLDGEIDIESTLRGMNLALDGWQTAPAPSNWVKASAELAKRNDGIFQEQLAKLGIVFGSGRAISDVKKIVDSNDSNVDVRRRAIKTWAATKPNEIESVLTILIKDKSLTSQVVRSMVHCESPRIADTIVKRFPHMVPEAKLAAINTLVSRASWSKRLLAAVENGTVPKDLVTAYHAGKMFEFNDEELRKQLTRVWGTINTTPAEKSDTIAALTKQLMPTGNSLIEHDSINGRLLFEKNCSSCHTLFGKGGNTGPDLTGADRKNLNYLLTNIVSPSSSVAESYRSSVISLEDGRLITGLVLKQSKQVVTVQTPEEVINVATNEIDDIRLTGKSVMPEGLLNNFELNEIADLVGYLMSN